MIRLEEWFKTRERVLVMGVLNVTPDSFYDGGRYAPADVAVARGLQMVEEGADIVDIGGESSRPGAKPVSLDEELERVIPITRRIRQESDVLLSVDTTKASVAEEALTAGASMINDVSALRFDERMIKIIAKRGAFVILMHMLGIPETMQRSPHYNDVVGEITAFLSDRMAVAIRGGISPKRILIDPGIGFGKRLEDNLNILRSLDRFRELGSPVVIGLSRKSFLGRILNVPVEERLAGTIAANAIAVINGADVLRVHDIKQGRQTADVASRLRRSEHER
jgi:dihydropteroate synthase